MGTFLEYHLMNEARKFPELAPKVAAIQDIKKATMEADLGWGNLHNLFVSFTSIEKLGINPKSRYATPLGIYAYQSDYVASMTSAKHVPFAGRSPHINLFKAKDTGKILVLNTMNNAAFTHHIQSMRKIFVNANIAEMNHPSNAMMRSNETQEEKDAREERAWKTSVDSFEKIVNESSQNANVEGLGGRFWYISMIVAERLGTFKVYNKQREGRGANNDYWWKPTKSDHDSTNNFKIVDETPLMWNKLFRMIGIDGCIDTGDGIIHGGEPAQVVFFNPAAIEMVDRIKNLDPNTGPTTNNSQGFIINRMGELMLKGDGESLGKYVVSIFKNQIELGMIGNASASYILGNNYYAEALRDVMFRRTNNNDEAYKNGLIKVNAIEASMRSCEIMMRVSPKFGTGMEHTLDGVIKSYTLNTSDVYYYWPILIYLYKMMDNKLVDDILTAILYNDDTLEYLHEIIKVCQHFKCEWWNDPEYEEVSKLYDMVWKKMPETINGEAWWAVRKESK